MLVLNRTRTTCVWAHFSCTQGDADTACLSAPNPSGSLEQAMEGRQRVQDGSARVRCSSLRLAPLKFCSDPRQRRRALQTERIPCGSLQRLGERGESGEARSDAHTLCSLS